jgi:hypothetical protein
MIPRSGLLISWAAPRRELRKRSVFLILRQLRLELKLLSREFAFLFKPAGEFLLREVAFVLAVVGQVIRLLHLAAWSCEPPACNEGEGDEEYSSKSKPGNDAGCWVHTVDCSGVHGKRY